MADVISEVTGFFYEWGKGKLKELTTLKQAGSNRQYFRAVTNNGSYIVTSNPNNIQENNAFIEFSKHFQAKQLAVPEILFADKAKTKYIQTDFGDISLFDIIKKEGYSDRAKMLY